MKFSGNDDNEEILDKHREKIKREGSKKYIFSIDERCIAMLDAMPPDERNEFVNGIICDYNDTSQDRIKFKNYWKKFLMTVLLIIALVFAAPLCMFIFNQAFKVTRENYNVMQHNFEILYEQHGR